MWFEHCTEMALSNGWRERSNLVLLCIFNWEDKSMHGHRVWIENLARTALSYINNERAAILHISKTGRPKLKITKSRV